MQNWANTLYPLFLSTVSSCTYASYTDEELMQALSQLAMRAIALFRFPRVSLEYVAVDGDFAFVNELSFAEMEVIVSWMKVLWVEYQLSKERNYENLYADKDVKAFSSGNLIASIVKALEALTHAARKKEEFYYRSDRGIPTIGDVNADE